MEKKKPFRCFLSLAQAGDSAMAIISSFKELESLDLSDTVVGNSGVKNLSNLANLTHLKL